MYRPLPAVVMALLLTGAGRGAEAATPTPIPRPKATAPPSAFSAKIHAPDGQSARVSAADCNRRVIAAAPVTGQLGPNGASTSGTLIAVPIGGANTAAATREQQISEACSRKRR